MKKFMKVSLMILVILGVSIFGVNKYIEEQRDLRNEEMLKILQEKRLDPISIKEDYQKKLEMDAKIEAKMKEIADFKNSEEYKEREYVRELKEKHGIESDNYQIMHMELSYYSDLNCENGYGNITATGEVLTAGMVANNDLSFGTNVYFEGHGMKVVKDRGSEKYFNAVNKFDVFVPRNAGESDDAYYRRVNNMGRDVVKGIIFF